ncbi:MAG: hypothetical protein R2865_11820 [Deinococcales bacterium]
MRMRDLVISKAIDQAAKAAIIAEAQKAKEALAHFPKSRAKVILLELADREIHRAK